MRWRSNGDVHAARWCVRIPIGGYLTGGSIWHSQCGESIFAHVPGLLIAFPSRARDAAGLLRTAFRCEDPVLFLEHKHLYRQGYSRDPLPPEDWMLPFGRGDVRHARRPRHRRHVGRDRAPLAAGGAGARRRRRVEIIDLRTIAPWDHDDRRRVGARAPAVCSSCTRTPLTCGFGAEIAAFVADECFEYLDAPGVAAAAQSTCRSAYEPTLEDAILPQVADITRDLQALLSY